MENETSTPKPGPQKRVCPYLGLEHDPDSHFSFPETAHFCFAGQRAVSISEEHQKKFCFGQDYPNCSRFVEPDSGTKTAATTTTNAKAKSGKTSLLWRALLWSFAGLLVGLLVIGGVIYYRSLAIAPDTPAPQPVAQSTPETPAPTLTPTASTSSTPDAAAFLATTTPTPTPEPGSTIKTLVPASFDVGWVGSQDDRANHFGDSFLYSGIFEGQVYQGAFQFDLSSIPRGASIEAASIQMTGLRADRLAGNLDLPDSGGAWSVRMLHPDIDQNWRRHSFQDIFNAPAIQTLGPILSAKDLEVGRTNTFELTSEQIRILEQRIIDNPTPLISFRVDGPVVGPNNLFAWDTGYGPQSRNSGVTLILEVGSPPDTPPPFDYVVVTSTPTPENIATAAVIVLQMTADATRIGTATPVPANMVTATPFPASLVIVPTPTPGNQATADAISMFATAAALTTGTATPFPTNAVTATPTSTPSPTATPTAPNYVLITSTPTPESIYTAATMSAIATSQSSRVGTPTPLPLNWVTPIVVTETPTPINQATAQSIAQLATAVAVTTGTPTATPGNVVTATPTPVFEAIALILTPTPTPAAPVTLPVPPSLLGKVMFKSDREQDPTLIYVYDPETNTLGRLTSSWPYNVAQAREPWSTDGRFRAFTKDAIRYGNVGDGTGTSVRNDAPALFAYDYLYNVEKQLTFFGQGIAYDGVWSPTSEQIAFVSNDSGDDEIWVINYDGSNLRQLTASNEEYNAREIGKDTFIPEISKYPSWSPDGTQIVFSSTRTGNQQLWVMNADGSDPRLLMGWDNWTPYNDWAPVWVKHPDPAPQ